MVRSWVVAVGLSLAFTVDVAARADTCGPWEGGACIPSSGPTTSAGPPSGSNDTSSGSGGGARGPSGSARALAAQGQSGSRTGQPAPPNVQGDEAMTRGLRARTDKNLLEAVNAFRSAVAYYERARAPQADAARRWLALAEYEYAQQLVSQHQWVDAIEFARRAAGNTAKSDRNWGPYMRYYRALWRYQRSRCMVPALRPGSSQAVTEESRQYIDAQAKARYDARMAEGKALGCSWAR